jgi:hypothetical protein
LGSLARALPVVPWPECDASSLWLGPRICRRVGGTRDIRVEALFPQGRERFELGASSWSRVLGIDAIGGPPYCNVADEGGAHRWAATLAGVVLDLVDEVRDQLGSLGQVGPPHLMATERFWNAREPGQRTWVGRHERW